MYGALPRPPHKDFAEKRDRHQQLYFWGSRKSNNCNDKQLLRHENPAGGTIIDKFEFIEVQCLPSSNLQLFELVSPFSWQQHSVFQRQRQINQPASNIFIRCMSRCAPMRPQSILVNVNEHPGSTRVWKASSACAKRRKIQKSANIFGPVARQLQQHTPEQ